MHIMFNHAGTVPHYNMQVVVAGEEETSVQKRISSCSEKCFLGVRGFNCCLNGVYLQVYSLGGR